MNEEQTYEELKNQNADLKRQIEFLRLNSTFENVEKENRAAELIIANIELDFQNTEKDKRAEELIIANKTIDFQSELIIAKEKVEESENKLRISENDFKRAQSIAHIGHWKWYLKTNEVEWSDEMFTIFGIDKNSYTGRLGDIIAKVIHPDDLHIVLPTNANEFSEKKPMEYRIILPDKTIRYVWAEAGESRFDENGTPIFINGIAQDITQRKQIEQALKESEQRWKFAIEGAGDGLWDWNLKTNKVFFSKQWKAMFGFEENEILDSLEEWCNRVHPDDLQKCYSDIQLHLDGKVPFYSNTHRVLCKDCSYKWILDRGKIVKFNQIAEPVRMIGTHTDLTERFEIEKQLIQLNQDKDRFITILAHDLKSPFNAILGFLDLLLKNIRKYDIDKIENQLQIVKNSAKNTFNLLEAILLWVRANSGKIPYEPQKLNFGTICNEVVENLKLSANTKNITINHFATAEIYIFADINMLNTVLRNLVSNSIKFTNKNGRIDIYAETNNVNAIITISDNGIGIEPNKLNKLLDSSQKITTQGTEKETGTGLGLLLCKEFVKKHGGTIWIESEVGKGSDFKFTMPLCNA